MKGDVDGFNQGFQDKHAGKVELQGDNFGLYWTLTDPKGWYVDTVAMYTRLNGDSHSDRDLEIDNDGHATTLSIEAGHPIGFADNWVVEPQVQVINQQVDLKSQDDGISKVSFDSDTAWTGRLGARLKGRYDVAGLPLAGVASSFAGTSAGSATGLPSPSYRMITNASRSSRSLLIGCSSQSGLRGCGGGTGGRAIGCPFGIHAPQQG